MQGTVGTPRVSQTVIMQSYNTDAYELHSMYDDGSFQL